MEGVDSYINDYKTIKACKEFAFMSRMYGSINFSVLC